MLTTEALLRDDSVTVATPVDNQEKSNEYLIKLKYSVLVIYQTYNTNSTRNICFRFLIFIIHYIIILLWVNPPKYDSQPRPHKQGGLGHRVTVQLYSGPVVILCPLKSLLTYIVNCLFF